MNIFSLSKISDFLKVFHRFLNKGYQWKDRVFHSVSAYPHSLFLIYLLALGIFSAGAASAVFSRKKSCLHFRKEFLLFFRNFFEKTVVARIFFTGAATPYFFCKINATSLRSFQYLEIFSLFPPIFSMSN